MMKYSLTSLLLMLILIQNISMAQCFVYDGRKIDCGQYFDVSKDGIDYRCQCVCGDPNQTYEYGFNAPCQRLTPLAGGQTAQGPTQAELDAYYNSQWTDQLSVQADLDFKKGMEAFNQGKCEKAVRHFNMARKLVSHKIYEDAYQAALACVNKNVVVQTTIVSPDPIPNTTRTSVPAQTNTGPRRREQGTSIVSSIDTVKLAIASEQKNMEAKTQTWVEYQKEQFKIRTEQPNYWCKNYVNELQQQIDSAKANEPWNPMKPKTVSELKPGDVILVEGTAVSLIDDMFTGSMKSTASHTLTFLKEVGGVKLFLDNQPGVGSVIISEAQLREKYSGRGTEIARMTGAPLSEGEVKLLWNKAIEFQQKNNQEALFSYNISGEKKYIGGTNYGIIGDDNMVCSEASWALVMATGRKDFNPEAKGWVNGWLKKNTIGFSPADFYENNQYFLISTLKL